MKLNLLLPLISLITVILSFFLPALFTGKVPIPADTIVGLYHPFRDYYSKDYPNGIPYKNFLITDPVRQQYPWKFTAVNDLHSGSLPLWNPYTFSGTPLLANFQSGVFYPMNLLFFFLSFHVGWTILIILQPILGGLFLYLYLRHLRVSILASLLGGFTFAYGGFSIAWLEWGNIGHTAVWLPLLLLSIDKIFDSEKQKGNRKTTMLISKKTLLWPAVFLLSLSFSFFAGHLQTFFYVLVTAAVYILARWWQYGKPIRLLMPFLLCGLLFAVITAVQWIPTLSFITESARSIDQGDWQKIEGWFIPWQHLVQFLAPDFFGNPTTLNYFGTWNYGELIGYVGLLPLLLAVIAIGFRRDKKTIFFCGVLLTALVFALPTLPARLPFLFSLPFLSTAQPTRLLFLVDFSLAVLAAFGFDHMRKYPRHSLIPLIGFILAVSALWILIYLFPEIISTTPEQVAVAGSNLRLPTVLLISITLTVIAYIVIRNTRFRIALLIALLLITVADISRFAGKFTTFIDSAFLYPKTQVISFLQTNLGFHRYMTTDSRLLPPNFSLMYGLQTVDGYDPLYLRTYGELIAASERGKPDIAPPFGFNRIITPHRYDTPIMDLLGVKYVLSLSDITDPKLKKVFQEGETRVYENTEVFPRAYFVDTVAAVSASDAQSVITALLEKDSRQNAVVTQTQAAGRYSSGSAEIISYTPNTVSVRTRNSGRGFLVLTDAFYPTWRAKLLHKNGIYIEELDILRTNYHFRGVVVPQGEYIIEFTNHWRSI